MANSRMKLISKIICLGVVLVMALGIFCACDKDDNFRNPKNGEPTSGEFYSLQTAYDNGWISKGDLRNIAYYYAGDAQKKGFKPTPITPESLSAETELAIKESFLQFWGKEDISLIVIRDYYGEYNGFIAMIIYYSGPHNPVACKETVGGISFEYSTPITTIQLWRKFI